VSWPDPRPGLVIRYSYLWQREQAAGREEGVKDRPCAIVVAVDNPDGEKTVYVLPVTHSPPTDPQDAVELPQATKARLGLDSERSWIVVSEGNSFVWPGPDLRFPRGEGPESAAYGMLPPALFNIVKQRFLARVQARQAGVVGRTE
jgi:hypothetical protein